MGMEIIFSHPKDALEERNENRELSQSLCVTAVILAEERCQGMYREVEEGCRHGFEGKGINCIKKKRLSHIQTKQTF